ncbi:hypothetical protein IIE26_27540 (plasmid) [Cytobacillus oceanisediminis]|uniref:MetQ/NlpA family ABC transporter substrate-binding protein n=1 Tax=Cytobacillus oceanisediminis TaxID=665099 RepID=UPI001864ED66|nr:MetQ/NlpA family ABC transporter substrate-binding protein [Cytobacillus oceanisediminis]QOK29882.1 hypothetical protein IIE26_27540 [Cytobacillus oceanisediminis]
MNKKWLFLFISIFLILVLAGCNSKKQASSESSQKEVVFGFTPGPYSDQVKKGIEPYLKAKGYTIKYVEFNDPTQPNFALAEGSLDANVFQHTAYFENFKKENKLDLTEVIKVPTAPMGIYSDKHNSLDEIKSGYKIAIPNDPPNVARALRILELAGWVKLKENYDPITVSKRDIVEQKVDFSFVEVEQAQLPRTLPDVDYALVNGNFILASGRKLSSSLQLEDPPFEYQNLVAVRTEDKDKQFVKDIIKAYKSPDFKKIIESDGSFEGFHRPDYFK